MNAALANHAYFLLLSKKIKLKSIKVTALLEKKYSLHL